MLWNAPCTICPLPTRHWVGRGMARASPLFGPGGKQSHPIFEIMKEVSEVFYRAKATLGNGNYIELQGEDELFGQIPLNQ